MSWQDLVLGAGTLVFIVALVPSIRHDHHKPHLATSILTGLVLAVFSLTFASLSLWFASATDAVSAAMWFILGWQVWRIRKQPKRKVKDGDRFGFPSDGVL